MWPHSFRWRERDCHRRRDQLWQNTATELHPPCIFQRLLTALYQTVDLLIGQNQTVLGGKAVAALDFLLCPAQHGRVLPKALKLFSSLLTPHLLYIIHRNYRISSIDFHAELCRRY